METSHCKLTHTRTFVFIICNNTLKTSPQDTNVMFQI